MAKVRNFKALLNEWDLRWNHMTDRGAPVFVTYMFLSDAQIPTPQELPRSYGAKDYVSFLSEQKANFRTALTEVEKVTGVRFIEVDRKDDAMLTPMRATGNAEYTGWASYPADSSHLLMNSEQNFAPGTRHYSVLLHEIGHAMGLKHPFEGDPQLADALDHGQHTVMSYSRSGSETGFSHLDVDALQYYYGGPGGIRAAWDYGYVKATNTVTLKGSRFGDTLIGTDTKTEIRGQRGNDHIIGRDKADKAWGGAGRDLFELGDGKNVARGGNGADKYIAEYGTHTFFGGKGNDRMIMTQDATYGDDIRFEGGAGIDTLDLSKMSYLPTIDLVNGTEDYDGRTFAIRGVEIIIGTRWSDWMIGDEKDNVFKGRGGSDTLEGGAGRDRLIGGADVDYLSGGDDDDRVLGHAGNDTLSGDAGRDRVIGGGGGDTLDGGTENDFLRGGSGADIFVFRPDYGRDTILDFKSGVDLLKFEAFENWSMSKADILAEFYEIGTDDDDVVGWSHEGTRVIINGVDLGDLTEADLI